MMHTDTKYIWALTNVQSLGPKRIRALVDFLQKKGISLSDFWKRAKKESIALPLPSRCCQLLFSYIREHDLEKEWKQISHRGFQIISYVDEEYSSLLLQLDSAPSVLYVKGDVSLLKTQSIAVVGTRKITQYGRLATEYFTKELVRRGYTIVSGFMYGVDAAAHKACVQVGGKTVAVLGYGFDHLYPPSHKDLFQDVLDVGGCIISEFSPDFAPVPSNFPQRNRIVAGLCQGILVTEASADSGSKITAQFAVDMGREVFAVSGSFTSPFSEGTKQLVNMGAKLVTKIDDVMEELQRVEMMREAKNKVVPLERDQLEKVEELPLFMMQFGTDEEKSVYEILKTSEKEVGEIAEALQLPLSTLLTTLSMMEMNGVIIQEKGKYWLKKLSSS